jgi:nucleotide-binding universal stress UspA family protein
MKNRQRLDTHGFRSIVCAVDFSAPSMAALQTAAEIAVRSGGRVTALYVEDPLLGQGAAAVGYNTGLLRKSTLRELQRLLHRVALPIGLAPEKWSVETILGRPAPAIVAVSRQMDADLIVMGTHGRRGPGKLFFGSTAEGVLRRASVPVMVVPRGRPRAAGQRTVSGQLLGAIELGPRSRGDVQRMAAAAKALEATLTLLHVVPITPGPPWFTPQLEKHDHARLIAAQLKLDALAESVGAQGRVVLGRPNEEIPAVALDAHATVIALVLRRGRGIFGPRRGTTTYRVLCGSTVPVLALPPM